MQPTRDQLLAVIETQTSIARLGLDLDGVMDVVAKRALTLTEADGAAVELLEGQEMVYRAVAGTAEPYLGFRLDTATSLSGRCVRDGVTLVCDDATTDPRVFERDAARKMGLISMVVVPLMYGQRAVGVLKVYSARLGAFTAGDVALLELMSGLIAAALHHATAAQGDELFRRATRDDLTSLANRALFRERLSSWITSDRGGTLFQVLMADLDGMKTVNDRYGHPVGDAVLKEVAVRLLATVRHGDTVARLGGDEFGILLRGRDRSGTVQERIRAAIDGARVAAAPDVELGISVGTATYPDEGKTVDALIEHADRAMYREKNARSRKRTP